MCFVNHQQRLPASEPNALKEEYTPGPDESEWTDWPAFHYQYPDDPGIKEWMNLSHIYKHFKPKSTPPAVDANLHNVSASP